MLWLFLFMLPDAWKAKKFSEESYPANRLIIFELKLLGQYLGHVWVILGSCLIISTICLLLYDRNSSKFHQRFMHAKLRNAPKCWLIGSILKLCSCHIKALFGHFYNIFGSRCLKWLIFSLVSHASQTEENHSMLNYVNHTRAICGPY